MRKLIITLSILMLVTVSAVSIHAHSGGGKYYGGPGAGPCWSEGGELSDSQRAELDKLHRQFVDDTAKMREEIWSKSAELDTLLDSSDPDAKKAKKLQREISELKVKFNDKRIDFELQARKIAPNAPFGRGSGRGYGRGYGGGHHHGYHGGYGHHGQHYGYGYGPCGN